MLKTKKLLVLAVIAALAVSMLSLTASAGNERTYKVTVTNLTTGQIMTPYVVATHQGSFNLFQRGSEASFGVQEVAENGNVPALVGELEANSAVGDVAVAAPDAGPPVFPGQSVSTYVTAPGGAQKLSVLGMLICTNDGFGGVNRVNLPGSGSATFYGRGYDAGTEINTEAYADLVPPCDGSGQTGMTNPALAENGFVHIHQGILGIADLDPATRNWTNPVIKVVVERIN